MLTDYEIDVLDNLSNIMLNNELFDEEKELIIILMKNPLVQIIIILKNP